MGPHSKQSPNSHPDGTVRASGPPTARLDITSFVPTVHKLFAAGLAPATKIAYKSGEFAIDRSALMPSLHQSQHLRRSCCCSLVFCTSNNWHMVLLKSYLAAVRYKQVSQGMGNANNSAMTQLEYVLKGVKKATPARSRHRLPITPDILRRLKQVWQQNPTPRNVKMSLFFRLPALQRDCATVRELVTSEQLLKYYIKFQKPCYKVWYFAQYYSGSSSCRIATK